MQEKDTKTDDDSAKENNDDEDMVEKMSGFIVSRAEAFDGAPFTIQR
jgi:hypothetical protein